MLRVNEGQRGTLSKPIGKLYEGRGPDLIKKIQEISSAVIFATIGDLVTLYTFQAGYEPDIVIIDFKTERSGLKEDERELLHSYTRGYRSIRVSNPQGHLTEGLVEALIQAAKNKKTCIIVDGEEDMAALPLALILPENSLILFGIPKRGILAYRVNERDKVLISEIVQEMEEIGEDRVKKMLTGGDNDGSSY